MAPPEISVTKSLTDCDLTQQLVGGIKPSSPGVKSMSADMFLDLPTMSAPSGEERKLGAAAQVERAGRCCRRPDSGTHTCWGRATVMVLVSPSAGPRVGGCIRAWADFRPYPVRPYHSLTLCRGTVVSTLPYRTVCAMPMELCHVGMYVA